VAPEKGKLVIFENVYGDTNERHELSLHAGMPVLKGEKYAFNLWFREMERTKIPDYIKDYL
jgi:prolyl 4-hydroxylase